jgi:hypothetical protein
MASRSTSSRRAGAAVLAVLLGAGATIPGCAYLRWRSLALTHADLIERLALDGAEQLASPAGGMQPGDIERMRYPLERAREFYESSKRRFGEDPWVADFDRMLGAYGELIGYLDRARTGEVGAAERDRSAELAGRVSAAAAELRRALAPER